MIPRPGLRRRLPGEALNRPFPRAYARWREAEARLDSGVDAAAIDALRDARSSALAIGGTRLVQECERLAGWHRIDLAPAEVAVEPGALDRYGLTPREVEVLPVSRPAGPTRRSPTSCSLA